MVCYPTLKCYLPFAGRAAHSGPRLGARHGTERKAPSFVIQMTNGTGSIRQCSGIGKAERPCRFADGPPVQRSSGIHTAVDRKGWSSIEAIAASPVTNPCGKRASLRSRLGARPRCPRSSGGNSERDGRRASPFGFGRTTGSPPLGRANRPARHIASLPSSLPVCLSVLAALCALRTGRTWSRMMATGCEVAHRRKNLLAHPRKRVRLVRWNRSARSVVNGARQ